MKSQRIRSPLKGMAVVAALAIWPAAASAQNVDSIVCNGTLVGGMYADVFVNGGSCTLSGTKVLGSVTVNGGTLTATNGTMVFGSIQAGNAGDIMVRNTNVLGAVTLEQSGNLDVRSGASVPDITMKQSGDATVTDSTAGKVSMEASGNLMITGSTAGEILINAPSSSALGNAEISDSSVGNISMTSAGNLVVESSSTGEIGLENAGDVVVRDNVGGSGSVAAILSTDSGNVTLANARVFPSGVSMNASGHLELCGSQVGVNSFTGTDGSGGLNVSQSGDVSAVDKGLCGASEIEGAVIVEKGVGTVHLVGTIMPDGDLTVIEQSSGTGSMDVVLVQGLTLSDVNVEKTIGNITMDDTTLDSDTTIADNNGDVEISGNVVSGDVAISNNDGAVTIARNSFGLEDVLISGNAGPVVIDKNCDMRLTVLENDRVTISKNTGERWPSCVTGGFGFTDADVTKNTGGVSIVQNEGEALVCSDNSPPPTGSNNTIGFTDGQCFGF